MALRPCAQGLENVDIRAVMNCELPTVACVLLRAGDSTAEEEVQVDMTPKAQASQVRRARRRASGPGGRDPRHR